MAITTRRTVTRRVPVRGTGRTIPVRYTVTITRRTIRRR